jgi:hypothetical protein
LESGRDASPSGADVGAGTAVLALGRVDHVHRVASRNRAFGAFGFASAAHDAFSIDDSCHGEKSFSVSDKFYVLGESITQWTKAVHYPMSPIPPDNVT